MTLTLWSSAFTEGEAIPNRHTYEGGNISPLLAWGEPPEGTRSFTLIVDDPDAPNDVFTHWIIFNIPADSRELPEGVPKNAQLSDGALQGKNDAGDIGYMGPCPPPGRPHRYRFTIYALDSLLALDAGISKTQLLAAIEEHVLEHYQLTGIYEH